MKPLLDRMAIDHRKLDTEIQHEARRLWPDALRLAHLKKLRLALRDRIAGHSKPPSFQAQA